MDSQLWAGDCLPWLRSLPDNSADSMITDPPYALVSGHYRDGGAAKSGFMGKEWDAALPDPAIWRECLRVLKPGAFAAVMGPARSDCLWRLMRDLEESGFDVALSPVLHVFWSGFPKSLDVGKSADRAAFTDWCKSAPLGTELDDEEAEVVLADGIPADALAELRALGF